MIESSQLQEVIKRLGELPIEEQRSLLDLLNRFERVKLADSATEEFMPFVKMVWPGFIHGRHHEIVAKVFERVARGEAKRVIINMAPRHTKSEFASYLLPSWFLGRFPGKKVIQTSHTAELAVGFGRKVRNLVGSDEFQGVFPGVKLSTDSKAAGRWNTNKGGEYFAIGVGGNVAGKGADLLIIDDPHSEQEAAIAAGNPTVYDHVYEWFTSGPRQRLQPGGSIIVVMTRWSKKDLTGRLVQGSIEKDGVDQWEVIELPAILPEDPIKALPERPMWPEFWSMELLTKLRAELPLSKWSAQYQQNPTSEEGALIKETWWRDWVDKDGDTKPVPDCKFIIMAADTAFLKTERSDYSAFVVFGVFETENQDGKSVDHIILLDAFQERMEFPELKERAVSEYKYWKPDAFIVEGKASGMPLVAELRRAGIPVQDFVPTRGRIGAPNDKVARVNSVTDIFASGMVWAPKSQKYAQEVIQQCMDFPHGDHDDLVDGVVMALTRFRSGGFIVQPNDERDEEEQALQRKVAYY